MCGVVARLGTTSRVLESVAKATRLLDHRGTRSQVVPCSKGAIGHVRLPIVGLGEDQDQPMFRDGLVFGFVGELLDFREVSQYAGEPCDVTQVCASIQDRGFEGLSGRDGFWGIVVLEERVGRLHVLTDYLAQKPMYYRADPHIQAAASEIDALVSMGPVSFDELYLSSVAKWGYCPDTTRTPFNEIKHLLPGEHVRIDQDGSAVRTIVDPLVPKVGYASTFKKEVVQAIRRRAQSSDVPLACLTSGGLDSSIVYAVASRYADLKPYYAAPGSGPPPGCPELARAEQVVGKPIEIISWGRSATIESATQIMQEPIDLGSLIPQIALSDAVKESVCLTGDGADEVFGGYGRSFRYDSQRTDIYHELVAWHLPRLDRVMMRNRIEVRTPFLARRVVELAMGLSHELRRRKDMLRIMFNSDVPKSVLEAPKLPLRSGEIERDREANSLRMIKAFRNLGHYRPSDPSEIGE